MGKNAIGIPLADVEVKLSQGDHGEILIKSPRMFTQYVAPFRFSRSITAG